jgi:hypothetical protein
MPIQTKHDPVEEASTPYAAHDSIGRRAFETIEKLVYDGRVSCKPMSQQTLFIILKVS